MNRLKLAVLLALVGMTALVPGSIRPELDQIDVPTLVALGEDDIAGDIAALPGQLPACHDLTLFARVQPLIGRRRGYRCAHSPPRRGDASD